MDENTKRVELLHLKHRTWLEQVAFNITKDNDEGDDLLSELYVYLLEKGSEAIWYEDTFNLQYCRSFIMTRWINRVKIKNRFVEGSDVETTEEEYNIEEDLRIQRTYDELIAELKRLEGTKTWASAKLASLYWFSEDTLESLSSKIGVSKSTTFLNVRKIREHLKNKLDNPFQKNEEEGR